MSSHLYCFYCIFQQGYESGLKMTGSAAAFQDQQDPDQLFLSFVSCLDVQKRHM